MKKILFFLIILFITSAPVRATVPSGALVNAYFAKRYVTFDYNGAKYRVDFNQVQSIVQNLHNHLQYSHGTPNSWYGTNSYYVLFKNGTWLYLNTSDTIPKPMDTWIIYTDFLRDNPQFLAMP